MKVYYKIMDKNLKGEIQTLFHGINGTKVLEPHKWIKGAKKIVSDGSGKRKYMSGFHVLPSYQECKDYLKRFTNLEPKVIVKCNIKGDIRPKAHSTSPVVLADNIKILEIA